MNQQVTPERIMQFAFGFAPPLMIEAAIEHRIFDLCDQGPKTVEELASETGCSKRGLRALLDGLVGIELVTRVEGERFALTADASAFLVRGKTSFHGGLLQHASSHLIPTWLHLAESVKTGQPARDINDKNEQFFSEFVEGIFPMSYPKARLLAEALKLKESTAPVKALDIAAGSGVWGIALAEASRQVQVTAVDFEKVLDVTRKVVALHRLDNRFDYILGDMQEVEFGGGYAVATLGQILHSDGREGSRKLIAKVYDALKPGGTIAIAEFLVKDDRKGPAGSLIFAVNMLVNTKEGDTFSFSEIKGWLVEAGFSEVRTLPVPGPSPLILADKPR